MIKKLANLVMIKPLQLAKKLDTIGEEVTDEAISPLGVLVNKPVVE